jgi:hypothetical protein
MKVEVAELIILSYMDHLKNYTEFNSFVEATLRMSIWDDYKMKSKIRSNVNPILLNSKVCKMLNIKNPFSNTYNYNEFMIIVKKVKCRINLQILQLMYDDKSDDGINDTANNEENNKATDKINVALKIEEKRKRTIVDFSEKPEILFVHNNITYYGLRKIVYNEVLLLNDINDYDMNDPIVLNVNVPKYIILLYIQSCYDGIFDIDDINLSDFHQFLNLIDQYPTKILSITLLELSLIKYMDKNTITFDDYIKNICDRYQLKYMYLYFNQEVLY